MANGAISATSGQLPSDRCLTLGVLPCDGLRPEVTAPVRFVSSVMSANETCKDATRTSVPQSQDGGEAISTISLEVGDRRREVCVVAPNSRLQKEA